MTGWYHDHALHITADNAYLGLAAFYLSTLKKTAGGCGEHWNLDNIEEREMMLADKVLDSACQLFHDIQGAHKDDLYGDVNMVSGVPFPNMPMVAKTYRFRFLNAAVARPYLLQLKNERLQDVGPRVCKVIATDGGYRGTAVPFPSFGLLLGVAERYEVVCDFSSLAGQTLYWYNGKDDKNQKRVCHTFVTVT